MGLGTPGPRGPTATTRDCEYQDQFLQDDGEDEVEVVLTASAGGVIHLDSLRPPTSNTWTGEFDLNYLDDDTRITQGDTGELRVFVISLSMEKINSATSVSPTLIVVDASSPFASMLMRAAAHRGR
ncbi:putative plastid-lipid-associated protein 6, chloroplastic [Hordeum vulgare]|nr:putative plastid-lipid-associated protein 6, chloroplastic [Hordeum vulgare]